MSKFLKFTTDIDECLARPCHMNATCTNNNGSYDCTCDSGFEGNGTYCVDKNECEEHPCHKHATCANRPNGMGYNCNCKNGYSGNGTHCIDVNECDGGHNCDANASCANTEGSFNCTCNPGYSGDGVVCDGKIIQWLLLLF